MSIEYPQDIKGQGKPVTVYMLSVISQGGAVVSIPHLLAPFLPVPLFCFPLIFCHFRFNSIRHQSVLLSNYIIHIKEVLDMRQSLVSQWVWYSAQPLSCFCSIAKPDMSNAGDGKNDNACKGRVATKRNTAYILHGINMVSDVPF